MNKPRLPPLSEPGLPSPSLLLLQTPRFVPDPPARPPGACSVIGSAPGFVRSFVIGTLMVIGAIGVLIGCAAFPPLLLLFLWK